MPTNQLQPGPELDALIAEVMEPKPTVRPEDWHAGVAYSSGGWWAWTGLEWIANRQPSTNPDQAGMVRRMFWGPDDGFQLIVAEGGQQIFCHFNRNGLWHVAGCCLDEVTGDTDEQRRARAEALAVCRAAASAKRQAAIRTRSVAK